MTHIIEDIDNALEMMWGGALDWATSDDFKVLREEVGDEADEAYLRHQNNLKRHVKAKLLAAIQSVKPEKRVDRREPGDNAQNAVHDYNDGWNNCADQYTQAIEELFK